MFVIVILTKGTYVLLQYLVLYCELKVIDVLFVQIMLLNSFLLGSSFA